jgi:hypothetical protein
MVKKCAFLSKTRICLCDPKPLKGSVHWNRFPQFKSLRADLLMFLVFYVQHLFLGVRKLGWPNKTITCGPNSAPREPCHRWSVLASIVLSLNVRVVTFLQHHPSAFYCNSGGVNERCYCFNG